MIVQAVETTRPAIEGRRHELALDLPLEPIEVEGDINRLIQIFGNLLSNAAKYTPPGGTITVRAKRYDDQVAVSVRDTGIGIESKNLAGIFDLFSQVNPKAEVSEGGLGAAIETFVLGAQ